LSTDGRIRKRLGAAKSARFGVRSCLTAKLGGWARTKPRPLVFGETTIPAGAYTLYMVPEENGAKLAFSKTLGGWGVPVDEKNDQARVDMTKETLDPPNDQLAMAVARNPAGGGIIRVMWEGTQYSAPFTVKK
jgi:hypothetical protein